MRIVICAILVLSCGLLDRYDKVVVPYGDVIDEQEKAVLDAHADKLVIESPEAFSRTVLPRSFASKHSAES